MLLKTAINDGLYILACLDKLSKPGSSENGLRIYIDIVRSRQGSKINGSYRTAAVELESLDSWEDKFHLLSTFLEKVVIILH